MNKKYLDNGLLDPIIWVQICMAGYWSRVFPVAGGEFRIDYPVQTGNRY